MAKLLLEHEAAPDLGKADDTTDDGGDTPLIFAAMGGFVEMTTLLLKHGAWRVV